MEPREVSTIQLLSGEFFDYLAPWDKVPSIEDIAAGLANTCRFAGQLRPESFYSVAQHSVLVSYLVRPELAYQGLMHDAPEAVLHDIASPLKRLLPDYRKIEDEVSFYVRVAYGLPGHLDPEVKVADLQALSVEQRYIRGDSTEGWTILQGVREITLNELYRLVPGGARGHYGGAGYFPLQPKAAYELFMNRYKELTDADKQ